MTNVSYNLTVNSGNNTYASSSSENPREIQRLLQLAGMIVPGDKNYSLFVTSNTERNDGETISTISQNVSVVTKNPEEINRLLSLSGVSSIAAAHDKNVLPCGCVGVCHCDSEQEEPSMCGCSGPCDCEEEEPKMCGCVGPCDCELDETAQASFDQGHENEDIVTFGVNGLDKIPDAILPQRVSSARFSSNPLAEKIHADLKSAWKDFLNESDDDDFDNEGGIDSPLTANNRQKFDKDPMAGEEPDTSGQESPFSEIKRQRIPR